MSTTASATDGLARLPRPPATLAWLLQQFGKTTTVGEVVSTLRTDRESSDGFLRLARSLLPGRRLSSVADVAPLLGETVSARLALLASGARWLRDLTRSHALTGSLLRHSFACATAAEAVSRDAGSLSPLSAFALGLLHHVGDAVALGTAGDHPSTSGALLQDARAPEWLQAAIVRYASGASVPGESVELDTLAAADFTATALGYAAPLPCGGPASEAGAMPLTRRLHGVTRRLAASIEDLVGAVVDAQRSGASGASGGPLAGLSPVVMAEVLDGVSTRDLGPLPVLFARISQACDYDSLGAALTAGVVEELEVPRAWFLQLDDGVVLRSGVLSARGNVPLPLHDINLRVDQLPRALRMALLTGRPILQPSKLSFGLESLIGAKDSLTLFVPVTTGKETFGVFGVEVDPGAEVVPDLLAAVAAHAGLALKAVNLKRLSDVALKDELTGLFNRRGILERLDAAIDAADATGSNLAIALIDCDHLKKVNDNFGHLMGDEFVRRISEVVRLSLRATDHLGRYGGDEFLAVLPASTLEEAERAMERARARVEQAGYDSEDGLLLSISVGAVVRGGTRATRETLLKLADNALYRSKERGRNHVTVESAEAFPLDA